MKIILILMLITWQFSCTNSVSGRIIFPVEVTPKIESSKINIMYLGEALTQELFSLSIEEDGSFHSPELKRGHYLLEVMVPGFEVISIKELVEGRLNLLLKLKPIPQSQILQSTTNMYGRGSGDIRITTPRY